MADWIGVDVPEPTAPTQRSCRGICADCQTYREDLAVWSHVEQGSGPGYTVYLCPECWEKPLPRVQRARRLP